MAFKSWPIPATPSCHECLQQQPSWWCWCCSAQCIGTAFTRKHACSALIRLLYWLSSNNLRIRFAWKVISACSVSVASWRCSACLSCCLFAIPRLSSSSYHRTLVVVLPSLPVCCQRITNIRKKSLKCPFCDFHGSCYLCWVTICGGKTSLSQYKNIKLSKERKAFCDFATLSSLSSGDLPIPQP